MMGVVEPMVELPSVPVPPVPLPKKSKKLMMLAGVAMILVALAIGLSMLGGDKKNVASDPDKTTTESVADNVYQNKGYFYELTLPPKWRVQPTSADTQIMSFTTSGEAILTVKAVRKQGDLQSYLATLSGVKVNKDSPIRVGGYDGIEQQESWTSQGVQVMSAYVKIQDMIYSFTLLPSEGKNAVTNESVIREYKSVLASFKITDTSMMGKDWVTYERGTIAHNWQISHPQNWKVKKELLEDQSEVVIYRDNYEIVITDSTITQVSICQFDDSASTTGYAGNLRGKEFVEFVTAEGLTLRRYFKANQGDKSSLYFCGKTTEQDQFFSPTIFGAIAYQIPAKFDRDILVMMDEIIKTIKRLSNE